MRYSQDIKEKARQLRLNGQSVTHVSEELRVPITTLWGWVSDIKLSSDQQLILKGYSQKALQEGRRRIQSERREENNKKEKHLFEKGISEIGLLTEREFLVAGIALYWAEGFKNKHERRLGFCNSDLSMVLFYLVWLEKTAGIKREDIILRLTFNISYKDKINQIEEYWSQKLDIPRKQFTKPFFQNSKWKKHFNNEDYYGVLRVHVKDSKELLLKMRGWKSYLIEK